MRLPGKKERLQKRCLFVNAFSFLLSSFESVRNAVFVLFERYNGIVMEPETAASYKENRKREKVKLLLERMRNKGKKAQIVIVASVILIVFRTIRRVFSSRPVSYQNKSQHPHVLQGRPNRARYSIRSNEGSLC